MLAEQLVRQALRVRRLVRAHGAAQLGALLGGVRAGPRAKVWETDAQLPHYVAKEKAAAAFAAQKKVFESPLRVMMSTYCRSSQIRFVGVSLFSPRYEDKAALRTPEP